MKLKLLQTKIAAEPLGRSGGQIIPTTRRVCYSAMLTASPRLLEPVQLVEIHTPAEGIETIYKILHHRRGHVVKEGPVPGTPIFNVRALLPALESFGFETDVRQHTQGMAFCQTTFDHWAVVPGDPLDRGVVLRPLEPAPQHALARELLLKTRRRKGMAEDVSVGKYFDEGMRNALRENDEYPGMGME